MSEWLGLQGKRVLVAGGAGTLGRAIVEGFNAAGATTVAIDRDAGRLASLPSPAGEVSHTQADLQDPNECTEATAAVVSALGGLDVFVHCAGINDRRPIETYTLDNWNGIVATNLTSAFLMTQVVAPVMRDQGAGTLVYLSSVAGRSGHKNHGPYAATKGAINQLMRVVANEYASTGVTANAIAPGYMETALTERYLADNPQHRDDLLKLIPAGRFGALDEVVAPVLFLASRHATFITGQVLYVDGGRSVV